jgi:SAM-dependent methyltransferase
MDTTYNKSYYKVLINNKDSTTRRNRLRLNEILAHKSGGHLLEIGCGLGGFLKLADDHFNIECVDVSGYALKHIREISDAKTVQADIKNLRLPPDTYDIIVIFNVLEHLRNPSKVLVKMRDSLVEGGILIGSVPNNCGLIGKLVTAVGNYFDDSHYSTFPPDKWLRIFEDVQFKKVSFFGELIFVKFCMFIRNKYWKYLSINTMFLCQK